MVKCIICSKVTKVFKGVGLQIGGFDLVEGFHREGSATKRATTSCFVFSRFWLGLADTIPLLIFIPC